MTDTLLYPGDHDDAVRASLRAGLPDPSTKRIRGGRPTPLTFNHILVVQRAGCVPELRDTRQAVAS